MSPVTERSNFPQNIQMDKSSIQDPERVLLDLEILNDT